MIYIHDLHSEETKHTLKEACDRFVLSVEDAKSLYTLQIRYPDQWILVYLDGREVEYQLVSSVVKGYFKAKELHKDITKLCMFFMRGNEVYYYVDIHKLVDSLDSVTKGLLEFLSKRYTVKR
jgi:hypothetical protein